MDIRSFGIILFRDILPVIAVIAVNNSGGDVKNILNPVAPWFYNFFYLIMVLMLATTSTMPKLAATTHKWESKH